MEAGSPLRFGVFELDPRTRELRKHGVRLKIQDQPFEILTALLEKPGQLVTREELRLRIWGTDTFVDFDQSLNRSMNKLREALGDGATTPRYIETMPRRGYRFIAPVESPSRPSGEPAGAGAVSASAPPTSAAAAAGADAIPFPPSKLTSPVNRGFVWLGAVLVIAGVAVLLLGNRNRRESLPPTRVLRVTSMTGSESHPSFSPDGTHVAFAWNGAKQDNTDIYVKVLGDSVALRLTSDQAFDRYPAFSPDGRQIAFASTRAGGGIYVISALGGTERKVADLPTNSRISWTPDGKGLLVAKQYDASGGDDLGRGAIFLVPLEVSNAPQPILTPPHNASFRDPAISPDGKWLAYVTCSGVLAGFANCHLDLGSLNMPSMKVGESRRLTRVFAVAFGFAWLPDSQSIVLAASTHTGAPNLWRVPLNNGKEERLELAGAPVAYPAIHDRRLVFSRATNDSDVWKIERGGEAKPFLTSTLMDAAPQFSADGSKIAFQSGREGETVSIWVCNADGAALTQLTKLGQFSGSPRWSADGRWIAFDSFESAQGHWEIWVVDSAGGVPRRLTQGTLDSVVPSWSRDGKYVYYSSPASGRVEIWKIPREGGTESQVTHSGGYTAFESTDGTTLYYTLSNSGTEGLYSKRLPDGEERQIIKEQIARRGFAVFPDGIYYLHAIGDQAPPIDSLLAPFQEAGETPYEIRFFDFAAGRTKTVASGFAGPVSLGLAVSPDARTFLFSKTNYAGADLMMIENFE